MDESDSWNRIGGRKVDVARASLLVRHRSDRKTRISQRPVKADFATFPWRQLGHLPVSRVLFSPLTCDARTAYM